MRPVKLSDPNAAFDSEVYDRLMEIEVPSRPVRLFGTTQAKLPPADQWPLHAIIVTALQCLALSTYNTGSSAWEWLRADGSAI